jgi:hypothetical protein
MIPTLNNTQINTLYAQQNCFCALEGIPVELPSAIEPYEFDLWLTMMLRFPGNPDRVNEEMSRAIEQARQAA